MVMSSAAIATAFSHIMVWTSPCEWCAAVRPGHHAPAAVDHIRTGKGAASPGDSQGLLGEFRGGRRGAPAPPAFPSCWNAGPRPCIYVSREQGPDMPERPGSAVPATVGDSELARRVVRNDQGAFEALMRRHNSRLFRVARA